MSHSSRDDEPARPPRFPRRRWKPAQTERVEGPERGGAYDRRHRRREAEEEIDDALGSPPDDESA